MPQPTTIIQNADVIVTMDAQRQELKGADIAITGGVISALGHNLPTQGAEVINAKGCVVTPGLVNTHHHLFQSLVRGVPAGQDALLFGWLKTLYPIFQRMEGADMFISAQLGLGELALSGCSLSSDHQYIFPNDVRLEHAIEGAKSIGVRFHATRGAMSVGESNGGLPPDALVEQEPAIVADFLRVIDELHDPNVGAMVQVALAPCSPFTVSEGLMRDAADMAADKGVMLHTHLAENDEDIAYSLENFGCLPGEYAERLGWTGDHVWHAHCVKLNPDEIDLFSRSKTGVAHCPCSNCRLGSGIAPVREMRDAGVKVGLGVDGSASSDAGHLLSEARQAMLLQRVKNGADAMAAREALEIATLGGAAVLNRHDLGSLQPNKRADIAIWDVSGMAAAGAWDPVAALVLNGPFNVRDLLVEGRPVVSEGQLVNQEEAVIVENVQKRVARLMS
ncbi:8-oxoguanine deaminase [Amylibacter marinus]|uniref:8-oxoguanine deaminase n=1 Tax=Amylibacter marinus TaxID=1475483 RepID=A0ABQ5VVP5_9RHOB|nr:8-oxoguanine deaminase [Amylibacter marinus]GLQ35209.1 8-oxoguanine deaminase [Amylibacter marinus]